MINNKKLEIYSYILFLIIEFFLYSLFLIFDFGNFNINLSNQLKYVSLILTFLYALLLFKNNRTKGNYICAYIAIAIADFFLLFTDSEMGISYGITFFIIGHLFLHFLINDRIQWPTIIILIASNLIASLAFNDLLNQLAFCYGSILAINFLFACYNYYRKKTTSNLLFSSGLFLLILCDLCVGLNYLEMEDFSYFMWLFYLPSFIAIHYATYLKAKVIRIDSHIIVKN